MIYYCALEYDNDNLFSLCSNSHSGASAAENAPPLAASSATRPTASFVSPSSGLRYTDVGEHFVVH